MLSANQGIMHKVVNDRAYSHVGVFSDLEFDEPSMIRARQPLRSQ